MYMQDCLTEYLNAKEPELRDGFVLDELLVNAAGFDWHRITRADRHEASKILWDLGYVVVQKYSDGGNRRIWVRKEDAERQQLEQSKDIETMDMGKREALRDMFASQAANGMFAAFKHWPTDGEHLRVAEHAYRFADAMLKERTK